MSTKHIPLNRRAHARDPHETHRASTPLELFFDLVFVVAIASAGSQLHHGLSGGHPELILGFVMSFMAIWLAWMNYSWYASAYDSDDVVFRLITFVIMIGALVFAAGIPDMFADAQSTAGVEGYVIMRLGMVALWVRAAMHNPDRRRTALTYAFGITFAQGLWVLRLLICPTEWLIPTFFMTFALELLVPVIAERQGHTPFHAEHMAERYSLLTIIVLGEEILGVMASVQAAFATGLPERFGLFLIGALLMVFSAWWWYFSGDSSSLVTGRKSRWAFGYGHLLTFGSLAATGSTMSSAVDVMLGESAAPPRTILIVLACCLIVFGCTSTALHLVRNRDWGVAVLIAVVATAVLLLAVLVPSIAVAVLLMGSAMAIGLVVQIVRAGRLAT